MEMCKMSRSNPVQATRIYLITLIITQCLPAVTYSQSNRDRQGYLNLYDNVLPPDHKLQREQTLTLLLEKLSERVDRRASDSAREPNHPTRRSTGSSLAADGKTTETADEDWLDSSVHPSLYRFFLNQIKRRSVTSADAVGSPASGSNVGHVAKRKTASMELVRTLDNTVSAVPTCFKQKRGGPLQYVTVTGCRWTNPCGGGTPAFIDQEIDRAFSHSNGRQGATEILQTGRREALVLDKFLSDTVLALYRRKLSLKDLDFSKERPCYLFPMPTSDPTREYPLNATKLILDIDRRLTNVLVLLEVARSASENELLNYGRAPFRDVLRSLVNTHVIPLHCSIRQVESSMRIRPPVFVGCIDRFIDSANIAKRYEDESVLLHDFQNVMKQIIFTFDKLLGI